MKNLYRGPIVELLNQETYLIDQLEKTDANDLGHWTGRQIIIPLHTSRNRGRGGTTDGGTLATAGVQGYLDAIVTPRYLDQGIEITHATILQSQDDEGAFVRALESEMAGAMSDLRKDVSRMVYGTGDGVLANWVSGAGTGASVTITVDNIQYIAVGDTVDALTKSNGTVKQTAAQVTAVATSGTANSATQAQGTVTLSNVTTAMAAGDALYVSGDRNNETDGLRNICNTGRTFEQVNSSTFPIWDSNVISAGQANPSEDLFMQLAQKIRLRSGGKGGVAQTQGANGGGTQVDCFLSSLGVQRRLANTYQSQKRWNDAHVTEIDGGYSAIMVAAGNRPIPVISDVDCVNGTAFALNKASFAWAQAGPPDWLAPPEGPAQILHLKDGATAGSKVAVWQAWIYWLATLACIAPKRNGQLTGFNDDVPVIRDV